MNRVGDHISLQIRESAAQKQAGKKQIFKGLERYIIFQQQRHEGKRRQDFSPQVPLGELRPAVAAFAPVGQEADHRHQVGGGKHMAAGVAVGAALGDGLSVDDAPGHASSGSCPRRPQQGGKHAEIDGNGRAQVQHGEAPFQ